MNTTIRNAAGLTVLAAGVGLIAAGCAVTHHDHRTTHVTVVHHRGRPVAPRRRTKHVIVVHHIHH